MRGTAQAAEGVFDFVSELANHQAAPPQLGEQCVLARQAPMLRNVFDFEEQPRVLPERYLSDGAVEDAIDSARRRPGKFALHDSLAPLARAVEQRQQGFRTAAEFGNAAAESLVGTEAQQGLRGGIQILHMQTLIQQKYTRHQAI